jgi:hypothetical protein
MELNCTFAAPEILKSNCLSDELVLSLNPMKKMKLTSSEMAILRELIFPESVEHILSETGLPFGAVRDDLMKLVNHGYLEVYDLDSIRLVSPFYDSDNIRDFTFKATRFGLKHIQSSAF